MNKPLPLAKERGLNVLGGTKKYAVGHISEIVGYAPLTPTTGVVDNMFWASPMFWKFFQPISVYKCGAQVTVRGFIPYLYFKI